MMRSLYSQTDQCQKSMTHGQGPTIVHVGFVARLNAARKVSVVFEVVLVVAIDFKPTAVSVKIGKNDRQSDENL